MLHNKSEKRLYFESLPTKFLLIFSRSTVTNGDAIRLFPYNESLKIQKCENISIFSIFFNQDKRPGVRTGYNEIRNIIANY